MITRTNEQWLQALRGSGPAHAAALDDLRQILVRGLRRGLLHRVNTAVPEFDSQAEDFAQEAILRILDKLDTFAGLSQFTTWAHKIAVSVALTELRRKRWQDRSLETITDTGDGDYTPAFLAAPAPAPEEAAVRADLLAQVNRVIQEELTDKQRQVITYSILQDQTTPEVARQMNMKPNAVYKLLHDARVR
ncbi:MAG: sigma-70 family RNA polymerase sigma factor, partial [Anaerolineales bacterium]|nr:sigma-70 family RNA polymerase sigma factor [Anaerolineales bacterium]